MEEQGGDVNEQENTPSEKQQESAPTQEIHTVTMQEYLAENVIPVQALENTQTEKQEEAVTIDGVTWQSEPEYDGSAEGIYTFINLAAGDILFVFQVSLKELSLETESGKNLELYLDLKALGRTNNNQQVLSMVQSAVALGLNFRGKRSTKSILFTISMVYCRLCVLYTGSHNEC